MLVEAYAFQVSRYLELSMEDCTWTSRKKWSGAMLIVLPTTHHLLDFTWMICSFCSDNFEFTTYGILDSSNCIIRKGRKTSPAGWVLKAPFTTNGKGIRWCSTVDAVFQKFKNLCDHDELGNVPYFILQPKLTNRMVSSFLSTNIMHSSWCRLWAYLPVGIQGSSRIQWCPRRKLPYILCPSSLETQTRRGI